MRYDHLLDPLSDEQPCGPDLEVDGDDAFIDYYYEALARIPERFVINGEPFDRKSVDIKGEVEQIGALLGRSRDLRLLVLEAKFQALAGKIEGFSDCVQAMHALLRDRWADVHPRIADGDATERRNQIELLDDRSTVVMPLEHAPLLRDRRLDEITYRRFQVAAGLKDAREGEMPGDAGAIQAALRSAENAEAVEKIHGILSAALEAVRGISMTCKIADGGGFAPGLGAVETTLAEITGFLNEARPDLAGEDVVEAGSDEALAEGEVAGAEGGAVPAAAPAAPPGAIPHHPAASAALLAVEAYFASTEPSAPGLLLIRQARKLIGRPLTEALDTLLPSVAEEARIDFGSDSGFRMDIHRLRALAEDTYDVDALDGSAQEVPEYRVSTRAEAMSLISAVESFFRQAEPSSPVPVLLFKAKNYMNRDFSAIVSELLAHRE